jgi:hypothetical protein
MANKKCDKCNSEENVQLRSWPYKWKTMTVYPSADLCESCYQKLGQSPEEFKPRWMKNIESIEKQMDDVEIFPLNRSNFKVWGPKGSQEFTEEELENNDVNELIKMIKVKCY